MEKITLLYAARHGETFANAENRFRGALNPPLNENGRADAESLAKYFEPICLAAIFYSDKKRSSETADVIAAKKPGIECFGTPSLWPWNVGMFSGQPKSTENVQKLQYYVDNPDIPIPDGESLNQFKNRIRPCLMEGMELANKAGKPVLFVVHSSVVHELGAMLHSDHSAALVKPGGIAHIYTNGQSLASEPLYKAESSAAPRRADTIS